MTIKEIAQVCGVSRGTVDRVVNHRGRVKPETEALVRKALSQAGYTKNMAGRALTVRRQSPLIGVILSGRGNPFFDDVIAGIRRAEGELRDWGVQVELCNHQGYDAAEQVCALQALAKRCAAVVVQPINEPEVIAAIQALTDSGVPVVTLNADLPGSARRVYVGSDAYQGGLAAGGMAALCLPEGTKIGVAAGSRSILGHSQRLGGFLDGLNGRCHVADTFYGEDNVEVVYRGTREMLGRRPDVTALFVVAAGCASACQAVLDEGLAGRVSVFGFDRVPGNVEMMRRGIIKALICQQPERQGHDAIRAAWSLLLEDQAVPETILMENQIRILQNVGE